MYFLADLLFVAIAVVPFGTSTVPQSKEILLEELTTNCIFVGKVTPVKHPNRKT